MRLLEHLKSLPPEDQLARKAELMDAARTGDRFGFDDSYLERPRNPYGFGDRYFELMERLPDGNWRAELLLDSDGHSTPFGDVYYSELYSFEVGGRDLVSAELLPPKKSGGDVKAVEAAAVEVAGMLGALRPHLDGAALNHALAILDLLSGAIEELRNNRQSAGLRRLYAAIEEMEHFDEDSDEFCGLISEIKDKSMGQALRNALARLQNTIR